MCQQYVFILANHHKDQYDKLMHDMRTRSSDTQKPTSNGMSLEEYNDENDPDFEPYVPFRKRNKK